MGNALATDSIPVLMTLVDVHNPKSQDTFYFANIGTGGAASKVIGRSQTLSAEVSISTILTLTVYECPEPMFTPEHARSIGVLRVPVERLAERYSSGIFQQWFNLDTKSDPRVPPGDMTTVVQAFEESYQNAVADVYVPKICLSVIGSAFEVQRSGRQTCAIFVGEDVKTQAGPDLKALIASHKQQAAYIDALHEELRRLSVPSYRPAPANAAPVAMQVQQPVPVQQPQAMMQPVPMPQQPMQQMQQMQPMMMQSAPPANYASGGAVMSNIAPMTSSTPVPAQ
jgi:hypothetical protein